MSINKIIDFLLCFRALCDYLMTEAVLAEAAINIGVKYLIQTPVSFHQPQVDYYFKLYKNNSMHFY